MPWKKPKAKMTICAECKHCFDSRGPGAVLPPDDGNGLECGHPSLIDPQINVVTGEKRTGYRLCSDINNGNCRHFEPRSQNEVSN